MAELCSSRVFLYFGSIFYYGGGFLYRCAIALSLYATAICSTLSAQQAQSQLRSYNYSDDGLLVRFRNEIPEAITFRWQAYDQDGRPQGSAQSDKVPAVDATAVVPVSPAASHYLRFSLSGRGYQILANRGVQFPGDNATGIRYSDHAYDLEADVAENEILLASGFRGYARTPVTSRSFEIGRTLGVEQGKGIAVKPHQAMVIAARGTLEAVIVTLTQRVTETRNEYWEYPLVIDAELRRYVIPLSYFTAREPDQTDLSTIHAISFRTVSPARAKDELTVDMLALCENFATLKKARRTRQGVVIGLNAKGPLPKAQLMIGDDSGNQRVIPFHNQRSIRIAPTDETRYWMCYGNEPSAQRCDPPDAPHTSYRLPGSKGSPISIDLFEEGLPLNAYRQVTTIFTSGMDSTNAYKAERGDQKLELLFFPGPPSVEIDYAGYSTPVPEELPPELLSVLLNVCKATASQTTMVGLRDVQNREPKIALGDYLAENDSQCQEAAIPLEAFRSALPLLPNKDNRLARLKAITVTLEQGDERDKHELVLKRIAFVPRRAPLKVASFDRLYDGKTRWKTSFRRPVWTETRGDTHMILSDAAGKVGRSLKVEIRNVGGKSYGLLALALGRVDVSPYQKLSFWIRGLKGGENLTLYLNDGQKREPVALREVASVTTEWSRVEIPLERFGKKLSLKRVKSILLAWEDELIERQTLYLDDFVFE